MLSSLIYTKGKAVFIARTMWQSQNPDVEFEDRDFCNTSFYKLKANSSIPTNLKIMPNPAQNEFELEGFVLTDQIKIYNNLGILVLESNKARNPIKQLSAGIYTIKVAHLNAPTETLKLVIQKN
jgi:hypothetical protein